MRTRKRLGPLVLFGICCLVTLLALGGTHTPSARAQTPDPAAPGQAVLYYGNFSLTQRDGPNCGFSGAPYTEGRILLWVDFATGGVAGELKDGQGSGWRRGLRCDGMRGDMWWSANYGARLNGTVDPSNGKLEVTGTLIGAGSTQWHNCTEDGEKVTCPPGYDGTWDPFPVSLIGETDQLAGVGDGDIYVSDIGLTTYGAWNVAGPRVVAVPKGKVQKNGKDLAAGEEVYVLNNDLLALVTDGSDPSELEVQCMYGADFSSPGWQLFTQLTEKSTEPLFVTVTRAKYEEICGDESAPGQGIPSALNARQPLGLKVQQGALGTTVLDSAAGVSIETGVATLTSTGKSHSVVSYDPATQASQFLSFQGIAQVKPKGPGATPIYLEPGQRVEVTDDGADPIVEMEKLYVLLVP